MKKVNLRKNERKKYKKLVFIIVAVFLFLFGSRLFLKPRVTTVATNIGEEVSLDTRDMTLINMNYSETKDRLSFSFISPVNSSNVLEQLKVEAKKFRTDKDKYQTNIKRINEKLFLVTIDGLGEKWKEVTVTVYPSDRKPENLASDQKFRFTRSYIEENHYEKSELTDKQLENSARQFELDGVKKSINRNGKSVEKLKRNISKIEKVNDDLTASLAEKTDSEKEEINSTISQNTSQIAGFKKDIDELEKETKELEQKQKIIEKGKRDSEK